MYCNSIKLKHKDKMFSSYDIARFSDVVYSEAISYPQFKKLKLNNPIILGKDKDIVFYKLREFTIKRNDIIFTHTGNLDNLFYHLKHIDKDFNLTLITHQSDTMITKKIFEKKPKCINKWFALNVDYKNNNLTPLPLGIANDYSYEKNIVSKDLNKNISEKNYFKNKVSLYINFNENTNKKERSWIKPYFKKFDWATVEEDTLSLKEYSEKIQNSSFVICPWGNGVESHRIWETLLLGSIPVVKNHITFSNLENLPILFVNDFKEINKEKLENFLETLEKNKILNLDKLKIDYWKNIVIRSKELSPADKHVEKRIIESNFVTKYFKYKIFIKSWLKSKLKILLFYYEKIKSKLI